MSGRRVPDPVIGFVLAVIAVSVLYVLARRFRWFGDDPTLTGLIVWLGTFRRLRGEAVHGEFE